jgi:hypothetical protein
MLRGRPIGDKSFDNSVGSKCGSNGDICVLQLVMTNPGSVNLKPQKCDRQHRQHIASHKLTMNNRQL